ncbi:hypothetical protein [Sphaerisporangium perillae]|uniref:hypothetical protein n=1 Tax=Sphaerisporangium perillae TaxID=2935860 RepID=UPI0020108FD9|nr:hypothetical protein [Sphaerisporangium perillae]
MRFDDDLSQIASALQQENPGWVVMWASWRRKFCAFSREALTASLIVEAASPERLGVLMRQVEAEIHNARIRGAQETGQQSC